MALRVDRAGIVGIELAAVSLLVCWSIVSQARIARAATGGPDLFGYTWVDSDEVGGPVYDSAYQPPSAMLGLCEQEWYTVNLGFSFDFYGNPYTRAAISANGVLYLTNASLDTSAGGDNTNACPVTAAAYPLIAGLWDDYYANNDYLLCGGGSWWITSVFGYTTVGSSPNRTFVASWVNNPHRTCGTSGVTFTVKLFEADGTIEVHYQDTTLGNASCDDGASATVGIADSSYDSGSVLDVACNGSGTIEAGYAVRFVPPTSCPDDDGDGYLDDSCGGDDCDDSSSFIHPGASEIAYDGVDQNCDGSDWADVDGDGFDADFVAGGTDCDDTDAAVYPGATEVCDGVDQDCDGDTDEDFDLDGDGYDTCHSPYDCWEGDAGTYPGAPEIYDGVDNDCDGTVDEGTEGYDDDGDGVTEIGGDCDDTDAGIHPAAVELADGVDQDCDGVVDEGTAAYDDDGDGYSENSGDCHDGDPAIHPGAGDPVDGVDNDCDGLTDGCGGAVDDDGDGFTGDGGDCDDGDDQVHPAAEEDDNGVDDDCDGLIDEGTEIYDDDGDGYSESQGDCDDSDAGVVPGANEEANGVDDDCDGEIDEDTDWSDDDGDGFTEDGGDCDDGDEGIHPGAGEQADGIDQDCDGEVDDGTEAYDDDLDGVSEDDGDCNDANPWVAPDVEEQCDGIDNDCDSVVDEGCDEDVSDDPEPDGCECAAVGSPRRDGLLAAVGALMGVLALGWRRRRSGSVAAVVVALAVAVVTVGCSDVQISRGVGDLSITPGTLDLGTVVVGGEAEGVLRLDNTGDAAVTITSMSVQDDADGAFCLASDGSATVERGESLQVTVIYSPGAAGLHEALLAINSDTGDVTQRQVVVRGQAAESALQVYPLVLDYGLVEAGDLVTMTLTLQADGPVPATITALDLEGDADGFAVILPSSIDEIPFEVPRGQQVMLQVEFAPQHGDPAEGRLRLSSDDPDDAQQTVALLGNVCSGGAASSEDGDGDGFSECGGDCNDANAAMHPGAPEVLDDEDNDCDGAVDEDTIASDDDGDGYSELDGDCDDTYEQTYPGADELVDGRDNDCDGVVDDGTAGLDDDGDGFAETGGDCDDTDPSIHPAAVELADGLDNDCDGDVDEGTVNVDDDLDGYTEIDGDCHDADAGIHPGAIEVANGVDDDCDGDIDEHTSWSDDDGDGFTEAGGDCDDGDAAVNPAAEEVAGNGVDDDCDGLVE